MTERCPYCGTTMRPVPVHGHEQCRLCHTNIRPCCDGEQAEPLIVEALTYLVESIQRGEIR